MREGTWLYFGSCTIGRLVNYILMVENFFWVMIHESEENTAWLSDPRLSTQSCQLKKIWINPFYLESRQIQSGDSMKDNKHGSSLCIFIGSVFTVLKGEVMSTEIQWSLFLFLSIGSDALGRVYKLAHFGWMIFLFFCWNQWEFYYWHQEE